MIGPELGLCEQKILVVLMVMYRTMQLLCLLPLEIS